MFETTLPLHRNAKIFVEIPFPEIGPKVKVLTKEQFRSHGQTILYHEYKLEKIVVDGLIITELHLRLPRRDEYKLAPQGRDIVTATKP